QFAALPWHQFGDNWSMPREHYIQGDIRLALYANDLAAMFRLFPPIRRNVLSARVERLDINIFHRRADIGESPRYPLIVSHDYEGNSRQRETCHVEITRAKMGFVPQIGHLVPQVHIIR